MQEFFLILLSLVVTCYGYGCNKNCDPYKRTVYQLSLELDQGTRPFYGLYKFSPDCTIEEYTNIGANSAPEVGNNISFVVHTGY
jgi:hypothetical protein